MTATSRPGSAPHHFGVGGGPGPGQHPSRPPAARSRIGALRARAAADDCGLVSVVLLVPLVVLMVLLPAQLAMVWHANNVVEAAAVDGLRAAQGGGDGPATAAGIIGGANRGGLLDDVHIAVDAGPVTVTATVSGAVASILPVGGWRVTATASGPVERFIGEANR